MTPCQTLGTVHEVQHTNGGEVSDFEDDEISDHGDQDGDKNMSGEVAASSAAASPALPVVAPNVAPFNYVLPPHQQ